ncbi:hypothetical protein BDZ89DRAFT_1124022 [Hymenopellis radicata]|nr:hypothetical protein BDZ89DRAFT_1124022 [Hymenopellis radicata]
MASTSRHTGTPRSQKREKQGKEKRSITARIEHGYESTKAAVKNFGTNVFPFQRRKGRGGSGPMVEEEQDAIDSSDNQVHEEVSVKGKAVILEEPEENWVEKRQHRTQRELDEEESRAIAVQLMIMKALNPEEIAKDFTKDDALAALHSNRIQTAFPHLADDDEADDGRMRVQAVLPILLEEKGDVDDNMQELPDDWFEKEMEKMREEEEERASMNSMQWEAGPSESAVRSSRLSDEWYYDLDADTFTIGSNRSAGSHGAGGSSRVSLVRFSVTDLDDRI